MPRATNWSGLTRQPPAQTRSNCSFVRRVSKQSWHGYTQSFAASFNSANSLTWANPRDGFSFNYDTATQTGTATFNNGTGTQTFFTVHLNSNGTYDFNLVTPDPVTVVNIDSLLAGIAGGSNLSSFTLPSSNFGGEFNLVLTGYENNGATNSTITISSASLGVGDNVMHGSKDDVLDTGELAWSVGAWLVAHGVSCHRLVIASYGGTKPISADPALNPRVEVYAAQLRDLDIGGMPADGGAPAAIDACTE